MILLSFKCKNMFWAYYIAYYPVSCNDIASMFLFKSNVVIAEYFAEILNYTVVYIPLKFDLEYIYGK